MASLLSFAFIALAFGLIDCAPVPGGLAYFNINPLGDIQALYKPGLFDRIPLINDGYDLGRYAEPYLLNNAGALGEDVDGFPIGDLDGLDGGLGDLVGGGSGGILDGGILDGGILDDLPVPGGSDDNSFGGIFGGGSGGILGNLPIGGGSGGILDNLPSIGSGSGGILDNLPSIGSGSGGILDNLPIGGGSGDNPLESLPDGGIPAGDGAEYLIGNYDSGSGSSYGSGSGNDVPSSDYDEDIVDDYTGSGSDFDVPSSDYDRDTVDSGSNSEYNTTSVSAGSGTQNSSNPPGADVDADTYDTGDYSDAPYYEQSGGSNAGYYVQTFTTIGASSTSTTSSGILNLDVSVYHSKYKR